MTWSHDNRHARRDAQAVADARAAAEQPVDDQRPPDEDGGDAPGDRQRRVAEACSSGMASPISRKATAVRTNARNSQTVSIASRARAENPTRRPYVPVTIPATTTAMIPDWWTRSASTYVP